MPVHQSGDESGIPILIVPRVIEVSWATWVAKVCRDIVGIEYKDDVSNVFHTFMFMKLVIWSYTIILSFEYGQEKRMEPYLWDPKRAYTDGERSETSIYLIMAYFSLFVRRKI